MFLIDSGSELSGDLEDPGMHIQGVSQEAAHSAPSCRETRAAMEVSCLVFVLTQPRVTQEAEASA